MTEQQQSFVNAFFTNNYNATKAAEIAGYAFPNNQAWEVKNHPDVKAEIDRRLTHQAMPANEVLARIGNQARASIRDVFEVQGRYPVFDPSKAFETGAIDQIKAITKTPDGGVRIEMYDAQNALQLLGRHHKLFTDKLETNNPEALDILRDVLGVSQRVLDTPIHGDTKGIDAGETPLELDSP